MITWNLFWVIVPIILALSLGYYFGRNQRSYQDYFLGSGQLPWGALSLSIVATETSTLTFIGIPALAYGSDWTFLQVAFGYILGRYFIAYVLLPSYWRGDLLSAYGYIKETYGPAMGRFVAFLFLITRTLADGVRLYATAIPVKLLLGIDLITAIAIIALVTILYTFWGGLKAVVWMDVIQFFFYIFGAALAIYYSFELLDFNLNILINEINSSHKLNSVNFSNWNGYGFILSLLGGFLITIGSHGTDQIIVQRVLAAGSLDSAKKAIIASGWIVFIQFIVFLLVGSLIYFGLKYNEIIPDISNSNEIFPWFIVNEIPQLFKGLIIAGLLAAAMSSLSSSLNALASSTVNDIFPGIKIKKYFSEIKLARIVSLGWGFILIIPALLASQWGNVLEVGLGIAAVTYIFMIFVFIAAGIIKEKNTITVFLSGSGGLIFTLVVKQYWELFWLWTIPIGLLISIILYLIFKLFKKII